MSDWRMSGWRGRLRALLWQSLRQACETGSFACAEAMTPERFQVRRDRRGHAEYTSNIALVAAGYSDETPARIAALVHDQLLASAVWPGTIETTNGFLNFHMNEAQLQESTARAVREGSRYGANETLAGQRINVEFVSADPTGPLSLTAGRIAATGEAVCRLLEQQGASVTREYFLNDAETSSKMRLLGESVEAFYLEAFGREEEPPEGATNAPWVRHVAQQIVEREGNAYLLVPGAERVAAFSRLARDAAIASQKETLHQLGVHFDVWVSENALRREQRVDNVLARLRERGYIDDRHGAMWLRTTAFGDETDRPLMRANGELTYLAGDIAYHIFKFERGFDYIINIWTAPHRTYIERTRAALQAAGCDIRDRMEVLTYEDAHLLRDGVRLARDVAGSSRELTLAESLREVDADTLRFLFLLQPWNAGADIDLEQARRDDEKNPAYAARLLPSRLATMLREHEAKASAVAPDATSNVIPQEYSESERALAALVALWPDEVVTATQQREPYRIARFVLEMATATRALLSSGADVRLDTLRAAQIVATNALRILGMEAGARF